MSLLEYVETYYPKNIIAIRSHNPETNVEYAIADGIIKEQTHTFIVDTEFFLLSLLSSPTETLTMNTLVSRAVASMTKIITERRNLLNIYMCAEIVTNRHPVTDNLLIMNGHLQDPLSAPVDNMVPVTDAMDNTCRDFVLGSMLYSAQSQPARAICDKLNRPFMFSVFYRRFLDKMGSVLTQFGRDITVCVTYPIIRAFDGPKTDDAFWPNYIDFVSATGALRKNLCTDAFSIGELSAHVLHVINSIRIMKDFAKGEMTDHCVELYTGGKVGEGDMLAALLMDRMFYDDHQNVNTIVRLGSEKFVCLEGLVDEMSEEDENRGINEVCIFIALFACPALDAFSDSGGSSSAKIYDVIHKMKKPYAFTATSNPINLLLHMPAFIDGMIDVYKALSTSDLVKKMGFVEQIMAYYYVVIPGDRTTGAKTAAKFQKNSIALLDKKTYLNWVSDRSVYEDDDVPFAGHLHPCRVAQRANLALWRIYYLTFSWLAPPITPFNGEDNVLTRKYPASDVVHEGGFEFSVDSSENNDWNMSKLLAYCGVKYSRESGKCSIYSPDTDPDDTYDPQSVFVNVNSITKISSDTGFSSRIYVSSRAMNIRRFQGLLATRCVDNMVKQCTLFCGLTYTSREKNLISPTQLFLVDKAIFLDAISPETWISRLEELVREVSTGISDLVRITTPASVPVSDKSGLTVQPNIQLCLLYIYAVSCIEKNTNDIVRAVDGTLQRIIQNNPSRHYHLHTPVISSRDGTSTPIRVYLQHPVDGEHTTSSRFVSVAHSKQTGEHFLSPDITAQNRASHRDCWSLNLLHSHKDHLAATMPIGNASITKISIIESNNAKMMKIVSTVREVCDYAYPAMIEDVSPIHWNAGIKNVCGIWSKTMNSAWLGVIKWKIFQDAYHRSPHFNPVSPCAYLIKLVSKSASNSIIQRLKTFRTWLFAYCEYRRILVTSESVEKHALDLFSLANMGNGSVVINNLQSCIPILDNMRVCITQKEISVFFLGWTDAEIVQYLIYVLFNAYTTNVSQILAAIQFDRHREGVFVTLNNTDVHVHFHLI